jgi:hypothetical protein
MYYITVKGIKIGDTLIKSEDGYLLSTIPTTKYPRRVEGYWLLRIYRGRYQIMRFFNSQLNYASGWL